MLHCYSQQSLHSIEILGRWLRPFLPRFTKFSPTLPGSLQPTDVLRHEIINSALAQNKKRKFHMSLLLSVQDNHLEVQGLASCLCANKCSNHWITFQTGGEYLRVEAGKERGQMKKIYCFHLWGWRWASWVVYIYSNEGELIGWQWKSVEGEGVDLWGVSILKEKILCRNHCCTSAFLESPESVLWLKWKTSERSGKQFPKPGCCSADIAAFGSHTSGGVIPVLNYCLSFPILSEKKKKKDGFLAFGRSWVLWIFKNIRTLTRNAS